ncbi:hypothetical protein TNCV_4654361 [Trichonephila clavipes]|nr:hypothetical protein TNCV_4654361 [Trichonephila clavipes]
MGMEIIKTSTSNHHCMFQTGTENHLSLDVTVGTNDNSTIPKVRSTTVYAMCRPELKRNLFLSRRLTKTNTN